MAGIDVRDRTQLAGAIYFAVGRATEGGGASYHLSITGITNAGKGTDPQWGKPEKVYADSGYSLGTIQIDLGKRGMWPLGEIKDRPLHPGEKTYVRAIIDEAARFAKEHKLPFTNDLPKLQADLLTHGFPSPQHHTPVRFIDAKDRDAINAWASSKEGMQWIHRNMDLPQTLNAAKLAADILDKHGKGIAPENYFEAACILAKTTNQLPGKLKDLTATLDRGGNINDLYQTITKIQQDPKHPAKYFAADDAGKIGRRYEENAKQPTVGSVLAQAHIKVMNPAYDPSKEKSDSDIQVALKAFARPIKTQEKKAETAPKQTPAHNTAVQPGQKSQAPEKKNQANTPPAPKLPARIQTLKTHLDQKGRQLLLDAGCSEQVADKIIAVGVKRSAERGATSISRVEIDRKNNQVIIHNDAGKPFAYGAIPASKEDPAKMLTAAAEAPVLPKRLQGLRNDLDDQLKPKILAEGIGELMADKMIAKCVQQSAAQKDATAVQFAGINKEQNLAVIQTNVPHSLVTVDVTAASLQSPAESYTQAQQQQTQSQPPPPPQHSMAPTGPGIGR